MGLYCCQFVARILIMAVGKIVPVTVRGETRYMLDLGKVQGEDGKWRRQRRFFQTQGAAIKERRKNKGLNQTLENSGPKLSHKDLKDALSAKEVLAPYKVTFTETANFWKQHAGGKSSKTTTKEAIDEWFASLKNERDGDQAKGKGTDEDKDEERNATYLATLRARMKEVSPQTEKVYARKTEAYQKALKAYREAKRKAESHGLEPVAPRPPLTPFAVRFGSEPISTVALKVAEIEAWMKGNYSDPLTYNLVRSQLSSVFRYLKKRKYVQSNPVEEIARRRKKAKIPGILSVEGMRAYIEAAAYGVTDPKTKAVYCFPELVPSIAIAAFSGIREGEIKQMEAHMILDTVLHLPGPITKGGDFSDLNILPTLKAWLNAFPAPAGRIVPSGARKKLDKIRAALGLKWPHNALRHSFASYRFKVLQDAEKVMAETRHKNRNTFHTHYCNQGITEEAGKAYWEILPRH